MKKFVCMSLAALFLAGSLAGCGGNSGYNSDSVVVYLEYNGIMGKEDDKVKLALEEKFKKDTGESIDLILEPSSTSMLGQKVVGALAADSDRIDAIISHYSSDSMLTAMITEEKELKDLTELTATYAPEFVADFNEESDPHGLAYHKGMYNGKLYALSTLDANSIFGMLVNRDYMAKTSFDPDEYDVSKDGCKSLSIDQFTQLLRELKENNPAIGRPLAGAPYDLDYFISPVYSCTGYTRMELVDGQLYPAYATEGYLKVMEYERMLQVEKLWMENPGDTASSERDFTAGKAAVYLSWPEVTSQINMARKLKKSTGADCVILAPLLKEGSDTETNGNARHESAFSGLSVPKKGQNTELLLKFINWLRTDKENYELAKYGVKGEHWEEATLNGKEAYAYPESRRAEYEESAPYSGLYSLLTNVHISNRLYAGYTEKEAKWVEEVHAFPVFPADGYAEEGFILPSVPASDRKLKAESANLSKEYVQMRAYAWSDAPIPDGKTLAGMHAAIRENLKTKYTNYLKFVNDEYQKALSMLGKN